MPNIIHFKRKGDTHNIRNRERALIFIGQQHESMTWLVSYTLARSNCYNVVGDTDVYTPISLHSKFVCVESSWLYGDKRLYVMFNEVLFTDPISQTIYFIYAIHSSVLGDLVIVQLDSPWPCPRLHGHSENTGRSILLYKIESLREDLHGWKSSADGTSMSRNDLM